MARGDWNYVAGSTNDSRLLGGIAWRYRDDLFGTSDYPSSRIGSNSDIIEYTPYLGRNSTNIYPWNGNPYTSNYKYSYNTQSGINPGNAENQLDVSTTYDFRNASVNNYYRLEDTSQSVANASSNRSRIIVIPHCTDGTSIIRLYFYYNGGSGTNFSRSETNALITLERINRAPLLNITPTSITPKSYGIAITNEYGFGIKEIKFTYPDGSEEHKTFNNSSSYMSFVKSGKPNTSYTFTNITARTYEDYWSDEVDYTVATTKTPLIQVPNKFVEGENVLKLSNYTSINEFTLHLKLICEDDYEIDLGSVTGSTNDVVITIDSDILDTFATHSITGKTGRIVVSGTLNYIYNTNYGLITTTDTFANVEGVISLEDFDDYSSLKPTLGTPMSHTVDAQTQVFTTTGVILGHTDMTLTIPASTAKLTTSGADVDKYRLQIGTQDIYIDASSTQSVTYTIEELNVSSFKVSVIDTRGIESDATIYNYTSYSYTKPTISAQSTINRDGSDLTQATISIVGTYKYFSEFTTNKNQITSVNITCEDRDIEATGISYSGGSYTCNYTTAFPQSQEFDPTESYQITITVTDLVGESTSQTFTLEPGSGTIVVDKRNKRVGIDVLPTEYPFEVNGDINIIGDDPKFRINGVPFEGGGGSGDTLPIGAIVDYEGSTVPEGYEEYEDNYSLYDNNSGGTTITLNDNVSNYSYIEIYGIETLNKVAMYIKVKSNQQKFTLSLIEMTNGTDWNLFVGNFTMNGNIITKNSGYIRIGSNGSIISDSGRVAITKVLGCK